MSTTTILALQAEINALRDEVQAAQLALTGERALSSLLRGELAATQKKLHDVAKRRAACGIQTIELPAHAGEGTNL